MENEGPDFFFLTEMSSNVTMLAEDDPLRDVISPRPAPHTTVKMPWEGFPG